MSAVEEIKVKVNWSNPIETVDGGKLLQHHVLVVCGSRLHILTFRGLTNPIVYNSSGKCLGQLNKDYICSKLYAAYEIRNYK